MAEARPARVSAELKAEIAARGETGRKDSGNKAELTPEQAAALQAAKQNAAGR